jgi:hypothetical protein
MDVMCRIQFYPKALAAGSQFSDPGYDQKATEVDIE